MGAEPFAKGALVGHSGKTFAKPDGGGSPAFVGRADTIV